MLKQEKELRGQTQALTWTAEAERASAGARKETDGAAGLWATGCGHVKARAVCVLRGQTQALTWTAEAENKREGPEGDGRCSWEPAAVAAAACVVALPLPNR